MHLEIFNESQRALLPLLSEFKKEFYMVGGTAVALHIGHRLSIDFDMFKQGDLKPKRIITVFDNHKEKYSITLNMSGQLNLLCRDVKFTFMDFEFLVPHEINIEQSVFIPSLLDLAAMKAYTLGRRSKWKDYLDLYFILKDFYSVKIISNRASEIFGDLFSERLFRGQLSYFTGISFEEQVEFVPGFEVNDQTVKDFLTVASLSDF